MSETWCVWAAIPYAKGKGYGWSRVAGELTQAEAEWLAEALYFPARAMPDRGPDHQYPVNRSMMEE